MPSAPVMRLSSTSSLMRSHLKTKYGDICTPKAFTRTITVEVADLADVTSGVVLFLQPHNEWERLFCLQAHFANFINMMWFVCITLCFSTTFSNSLNYVVTTSWLVALALASDKALGFDTFSAGQVK